MTDKPAFAYVTHIESTPEKVWDALTDADLTAASWATAMSRIGAAVGAVERTYRLSRGACPADESWT